ncbi:MAG TPA: NADH-quinone oxidoreductase subunit NuoK [Thermomonas sp.]|nr:NADH-quinone oxidoreductase subunit NuoK [Thermomonas sp.]
MSGAGPGWALLLVGFIAANLPFLTDRLLLVGPRRSPKALGWRLLELLLLSVNINFVGFSRSLGDPAGQVFVFFILTVAAAEAAIGLAILVTLFRNRRTIDVADIDSLKG